MNLEVDNRTICLKGSITKAVKIAADKFTPWFLEIASLKTKRLRILKICNQLILQCLVPGRSARTKMFELHDNW